MGNGALRAGLEPGTPIVDTFVVISEVSACMLVVAIMGMPFCATLSESTLFCGDVICVAAPRSNVRTGAQVLCVAWTA